MADVGTPYCLWVGVAYARSPTRDGLSEEHRSAGPAESPTSPARWSKSCWPSSTRNIRIIDMLILVKDADGSVDAMELSELEDLGELQTLKARLTELVVIEDVERLAAAMDPGSTAGVIICETSGLRGSHRPSAVPADS